ncbi:P1 family peptidase [Teichococcus aestuarii]|uniref:P1 family peptidase n=1 Tax=Teichococcus aestuarii TaxID=568898 RepID=UPI00361EA37F
MGRALRAGGGIRRSRPAGALHAGGSRPRLKGGAPSATTIGLVVTDAALSKAQAKRLAIMADDGLARAVLPAHAPMTATRFSPPPRARSRAPTSPRSAIWRRR